MKLKDLCNHFLISTQSLNDTIFKKSIILLCDHSHKGSMGLILNKPMLTEKNKSLFLDSIFNQTEINSKIYFGGPVDLNTCFILHDSSYLNNETIQISDELSITSNNKIINDLKNGKGPNTYRLNIGYAGWSSGQLEEEIQNGDWLLTPAQNNFIFKVPDEQMWTQSTEKIGLNIQDICGPSGTA
tara:strand:- start:158 stop:712 length:555 start_codon:yes stop_codon:yes gene_type:complete